MYSNINAAFTSAHQQYDAGDYESHHPDDRVWQGDGLAISEHDDIEEFEEMLEKLDFDRGYGNPEVWFVEYEDVVFILAWTSDVP